MKSVTNVEYTAICNKIIKTRIKKIVTVYSEDMKITNSGK